MSRGKASRAFSAIRRHPENIDTVIVAMVFSSQSAKVRLEVFNTFGFQTVV